MITIHKFTLNFNEDTVKLKGLRRILCVKTQREEPQLWVEVDTTKKTEVDFKYRIYGTGHEIKHEDVGFTYLDTFMLEDGKFVFHVYGSLPPRTFVIH